MIVIHLARKPLSEGTLASNALKHGTGGLNVDGGRIAGEDVPSGRIRHGGGTNTVYAQDEWTQRNQATMGEAMPAGRWPANLILEHRSGCGTECVQGCPVAAVGRANEGVGRFFRRVR